MTAPVRNAIGALFAIAAAVLGIVLVYGIVTNLTGGNEDAKACIMLRDARGEDAGIYADLYRLDLSDSMRADLEVLERGDEDLFDAAGRVMAHCANEGVLLTGS